MNQGKILYHVKWERLESESACRHLLIASQSDPVELASTNLCPECAWHIVLRMPRHKSIFLLRSHATGSVDANIRPSPTVQINQDVCTEVRQVFRHYTPTPSAPSSPSSSSKTSRPGNLAKHNGLIGMTNVPASQNQCNIS